MALRELLTDVGTQYRNLKFGNDRPGGGSSKQPFIIKDLPPVESDPDSTFPDFILRDPKNQLENRVDDLSRISKFLVSRNGGLFIAKQQLLSLQNPLVPGRPNRSNPVAGLYNPLMTLAQVAGAGTGLHIEKQGALPIFNDDVKYANVYRRFHSEENNNRLTLLKISKIGDEPGPDDTLNPISFISSLTSPLEAASLGIASNDNFILSYTGGPDSFGLGRTRIPFSNDRLSPKELEQRTEESKKESFNKTANYSKSIITTLGLSEKYLNPDQEDDTTLVNANNITIGSYVDDLLGINNQGIIINGGQLRSAKNIAFLRDPIDANAQINAALSQSFNRTSLPLTSEDIIRITKSGVSQESTNLKYITIKTSVTDGGDNFNITNQLFQNSVYTLGNTFPTENTANTKDKGVYTFNQTQLRDKKSILSFDESGKAVPSDFRKDITGAPNTLGIYSFDYQNAKINRMQRIGDGNPGKRTRNRSKLNIYDNATVDRINMIPLYRDRIVLDPDVLTRDLVKFRFEVIDNTNPDISTFVHFRAFLGTITDQYNSDWEGYRFVGRGDKVWNYQGSSRAINFSFKVAAQSRAEMRPLYQKLNYLASSLSPDYNGGYMKGNLIRLTIGDYLMYVPGFITSLTYTIPEEASWEIAINSPELGEDKGLMETPKYFDVDVAFTPIHDFTPRLNDGGRDVAFITNPTGVGGKENQYLDNNKIHFFANGNVDNAVSNPNRTVIYNPNTNEEANLADRSGGVSTINPNNLIQYATKGSEYPPLIPVPEPPGGPTNFTGNSFDINSPELGALRVPEPPGGPTNFTGNAPTGNNPPLILP